MKCKFNSGTVNIIILALILTAGISACCICFNGLYLFAYLLLFSILFLLVCKNFDDNEIIADEKRVTIIYRLFRLRICRFSIALCDIEYADCSVSAYGNRSGSVGYCLNFIIKKNNGRKTVLYKFLDIDRDFPINDPDEYKQYIEEQPLMKLKSCINGRTGHHCFQEDA